MRLLVIEDDSLLAEGIRTGLTRDGHAVDVVADGRDGLAALEGREHHAVILDLGLPGMSGIEVLRQARSRRIDTPILILTARDAVSDRVAGLDAGADDYLVKPFNMQELLARLRALTRRGSGRATPTICRGSLVLDPGAHTVFVDGSPVDLSPREFAILRALLENQGRVLSREQLEGTLYGWEDSLASNTVEVYIHHLRKKLGAEIIRTIRGVGYLISPEESNTTA